MTRYIRYENSKEEANRILATAQSQPASTPVGVEAVFEIMDGLVALHAVMDEFLRTEKDHTWLVVYSGHRADPSRADSKVFFIPESIDHIYSYRQVHSLRTGTKPITHPQPTQKPRTKTHITRWLDRLWVPLSIMIAIALFGFLFVQLTTQAQASLKPQYRYENSATSPSGSEGAINTSFIVKNTEEHTNYTYS